MPDIDISPAAIAERVDYFRNGVDMPATADLIESLATDRDRIAKERDEADRRAGAAERRLEHAEEAVRCNRLWTDERKRELGYNYNTSFDDVWAAAISRAEKAERERGDARRENDVLRELLAKGEKDCP